MNRKRDFFFQFTWMISKMACENARLNHVEKLMSNLHLEEPNQITDQVFLGSTQRESETNKTNCDRKVRSWSYNTQGHAQKCVERYCELANKHKR